MALLRLALASLSNRRVAAGLTVLSIALSVALLLTVEHLRRDARTAFTNTVSGTDLIVGAPIGDVQLLLQTIFRIGHSGGAVSGKAIDAIRHDPRVEWVVPISLGDAYRGYPVVGTSTDYFAHYRVGQRQALRFESGKPFESSNHAVVGADVAQAQGLSLGQSIVLAHGRGEIETEHHDDAPFTIVGILSRTGTPVDRTVHISMAGVEQVHGAETGAGDADPLAALRALSERVHDHERESKEHAHENQKDDHDHPVGKSDHVEAHADQELPANALLIGLHKKTDLLSLQREIGQTKTEPLQAVIPGVALQQLWDIFSVAEDLLRLMSWLVVVAGLMSMLIVIVATLESRRREMAVLRAVGASPAYVGGLFVAEAAVLAALGIAVGVVVKFLAQWMLNPWVAERFGVQLPKSLFAQGDGWLLLVVWIAAILVALVPAWRAMRLALSDGLLVRG